MAVVDKIKAQGCNRISCGCRFYILWFVFHYMTFYGRVSAESQNEKKKNLWNKDKKRTREQNQKEENLRQ